jgi:CubicO group peptidase (beta-lactamase class C family)
MVYPTPHWEILEPSAAGWSADLLDKARSYAGAAGSSAVMIVQHGRVIAEWGDTSRRTDVASIRKSLLSALFGIAIAEGRVKLTDTLANLGIDDKPPSLTSSELQATLADLLTSRSGIYHPIDFEPAAVAAQRPARGSHAPGEFWFYNNWDFNAAGSIYEKIAAADIFTAFSDGTASLQKGFARKQAYLGKWWVDGAKLCRGWDQFHPRFDCWPVAISGATVSLYGEHDTMFIQGSLENE